MEELKLHIGGTEAHPDWTILDIELRPEVDIVADASDLSEFEDNSVSAIYSSHVLEHFYYHIDNQIGKVLKEWHRVLKPGGQLMLSVPDLRLVTWLYQHPYLSAQERMGLMSVMFGGQKNIYDVHKVGFDGDLLAYFLQEAGFKQMERVREFDLFNDHSKTKFLGQLISLNVIATKDEC